MAESRLLQTVLPLPCCPTTSSPASLARPQPGLAGRGHSPATAGRANRFSSSSNYYTVTLARTGSPACLCVRVSVSVDVGVGLGVRVGKRVSGCKMDGQKEI